MTCVVKLMAQLYKLQLYNDLLLKTGSLYDHFQGFDWLNGHGI